MKPLAVVVNNHYLLNASLTCASRAGSTCKCVPQISMASRVGTTGGSPGSEEGGMKSGGEKEKLAGCMNR